MRLHQMRVRQGDPAANAGEILRLLARDRADGVEVSVFPEWALCGALGPGEWLNPLLGEACDRALERVAAATEGGPAAVLGTACLWRGRRVCGAVAAAGGRPVRPEGSPVAFVPKWPFGGGRLDGLTGRGEALEVAFREGAAPEALFAPFRLGRRRVGAWCGEGAPGGGAAALGRGADTLVSLVSRPYERDRRGGAAACPGAPRLVCGAVGLVDAGRVFFVLEGGTGWVYPNGAERAAPLFEEASLDWGAGGGTSARDPAAEASDGRAAQAMEGAVRGLLGRLGLSRVVIGASGGIDSALAAAVYSRAVAPGDLLLVNMPSRHNSGTTIRLARRLAGAIGCRYAEVPIGESAALTARQLDGLFCGLAGAGAGAAAGAGAGDVLRLSALARENVQARDRSGRVLAAAAAAFGGVFTCNTNKSEAVIGYGTLYGDLCGFFAVMADLWKTEVRSLAGYYNREVFGREVIPQGSIDIVPSAELSAEQSVDEGRGDPLVYPWHDRLFAAWTERREPLSPGRLEALYREGEVGAALGYGGDVRELFPTEAAFRADVRRWWRLYGGLARAKRLQAAPVLSLKSRTFGFDLGAAQLPAVGGDCGERG